MTFLANHVTATLGYADGKLSDETFKVPELLIAVIMNACNTLSFHKRK